MSWIFFLSVFSFPPAHVAGFREQIQRATSGGHAKVKISNKSRNKIAERAWVWMIFWLGVKSGKFTKWFRPEWVFFPWSHTVHGAVWDGFSPDFFLFHHQKSTYRSERRTLPVVGLPSDNFSLLLRPIAFVTAFSCPIILPQITELFLPLSIRIQDDFP